MHRTKTKNRVLVSVAIFLFVFFGVCTHSVPNVHANTLASVVFANIGLADGQVGNAYSAIIPISYQYGTSLTLQMDNVPPGLSASLGSADSTTTGVSITNDITLSGTPTQSGIYRMTANLSDSTGSVVGMQQYNLTITTATGSQTPSLSLSNNPQLLASGLGTANPTFAVSAGQQSATLWAGDLTASPAQDITVSGMDLFSTTDLSQYFTNFRIMDGTTLLGSSPDTLTFQFSINTVIAKGTTHTLTMIGDVLPTAQMPTTLSGLNVTLYATHVDTTAQNIAENGFAQGSVLIIAAVASPSPFTNPVVTTNPTGPVTNPTNPASNNTPTCSNTPYTVPPMPTNLSNYPIVTNSPLQVRLSQDTGLAAYDHQLDAGEFSSSVELFDLYLTNTSLTDPMALSSVTVNDDGNLSDFSRIELDMWDSDNDELNYLAAGSEFQNATPTSVQNGQLVFSLATPLVIPPNNTLTAEALSFEVNNSAVYGSGHRYYLASPSSVVVTDKKTGAAITPGGIFPTISQYPVVVLPCNNPNFVPAALSVAVDPNAPPAYSVKPGTTSTVLASYTVKNSAIGYASLTSVSLTDSSHNYNDITNLRLYSNSQQIGTSLPTEQAQNNWQFDCVYNVLAPCPTSNVPDLSTEANTQTTLTFVGDVSAQATPGDMHSFTISLQATGALTDPTVYDTNQLVTGSGTVVSNPITVQPSSSSPAYGLPSGLTTTGSGISISPMNLPVAIQDINYTATVPFTYTGTSTLTATWTGLPEYVYGDGNSSNPNTITINPGSNKTSLTLSGLPRDPGLYPIALTIADGNGNSATSLMLLTVNTGGACSVYPQNFPTVANPNAKVGQPYTLIINYDCTPNTTPINYRFSAPSWLTVSPPSTPSYYPSIWGNQVLYGISPNNNVLTITLTGTPTASDIGTVNITTAKNDLYDHFSDRNFTVSFQVTK